MIRTVVDPLDPNFIIEYDEVEKTTRRVSIAEFNKDRVTLPSVSYKNGQLYVTETVVENKTQAPFQRKLGRPVYAK